MSIFYFIAYILAPGLVFRLLGLLHTVRADATLTDMFLFTAILGLRHTSNYGTDFNADPSYKCTARNKHSFCIITCDASATYKLPDIRLP